jgi:ABC-type sulfate transport system permease subunit
VGGVLPSLLPAILTGFALAFARAVGEYGSVIFIAGNIPRQTEIAPLLIVIRLEEFDYAGAAAIAAVMLAISFLILLRSTSSRRGARGGSAMSDAAVLALAATAHRRRRVADDRDAPVKADPDRDRPSCFSG